jgi:caa(3)-type oxidase subunit IV
MTTLTEPLPPTSHAETVTSDAQEHVLPLKVYFTVYGALLVLTGITVQVSRMNLGEVALYVAMTVAIVKASLVVGYFMHLKFETRFTSLVFFSSLLFLVIFFTFTMIDLKTRGMVDEVQDNFELHDRQAIEKKAQQKLHLTGPNLGQEHSSGSHGHR